MTDPASSTNVPGPSNGNDPLTKAIESRGRWNIYLGMLMFFVLGGGLLVYSVYALYKISNGESYYSIKGKREEVKTTTNLSGHYARVVVWIIFSFLSFSFFYYMYKKRNNTAFRLSNGLSLRTTPAFSFQ